MIRAHFGEDIILHCHLQPPINATNMEVRWFRSVFTDPVHLYKNKEDYSDIQNNAYKTRTELLKNELAMGQVYLKLKNIQVSDEGKFTCLVDSKLWYEESYVEVKVGDQKFFCEKSNDFKEFCIREITVSKRKLMNMVPLLSKCKKLSLRACDLTDRCCEPLSSILKMNQSLMELDLSWNPLGHSGLRLICDGLKNENCNVQKLTLRLCRIPAAGCEDLASFLITSESLTELDLSANQLEDSGAKQIFEALKRQNCKIEKLRLCWLGLTARCSVDLASVLRTSPSLIELDLSNNFLGDSGGQEIYNTLIDPNCRLQLLGMTTA
nr:PREDICTED: ribonuclease inhibitor-like [Latimeria chalumnae]|eukprot:XP_014353045.1 PREDICTED: ribonuclease inhibitor-like [Latimeria chalumnae]